MSGEQLTLDTTPEPEPAQPDHIVICCSYCPDGRPATGLHRGIPICGRHL